MKSNFKLYIESFDISRLNMYPHLRRLPLQVTHASSPSLYKLRSMTADDIASYAATVSKIGSQADSFVPNWEAFVSNDNTLPPRQNLADKLASIHATLQPISRLLFPLWVMDRYKEALDQYTRGEWLSSISLSGDIVEFIVSEFWEANLEKIPSGERKKSSSVRRNLQTMKDNHIIEDEDFGRLYCVRVIRDDHVHEFNHKRLRNDYYDRLKADDIKALQTLADFFADHNILSKYRPYLEFAAKRSGLVK